jgi:5-methyltetrahydrofolate--homocysteine methyltransferase
MYLETIYHAVLNGNTQSAIDQTAVALEANVLPQDVLYQACMPAMTEVGRLFERGEKFVPEMLIAARAMQSTVNMLKPHLVETETRSAGKVVLGTVAGDLHDIGKNLVGMMMEGTGFEVIDLGTDVACDGFVNAVQEHQPDIVGLSALLTTTMPAIADVINALKRNGLRGHVKVMIGGAPVTQGFADKVGADGFAPDAGSAARVAQSLVQVAVPV